MKKFFRVSLNFVLANLVILTLSAPLRATWNDDLQTLTTEELTSKCHTKLKFYEGNSNKKSKWKTRLETIQNVAQTMRQPLHEVQDYLGENPTPIVLVVDDSDFHRKYVKQWLLKNNYQVVEAEDGQVAITYCQKQTFYCIIMDWEMPNIDGPTTAEHLRTKLKLTTPIFGLTSRDQESDIEEFMSRGATHVFSKPFNQEKFSQLKEIVKNLKGALLLKSV